MKSVVGGVTTYYVGNHYEVKNSVVTKYYFAGATRLAVRTNGTLSYLLGDHLGSSSVTTDANGAKTASALYKAFGETRYTLGNLGTDYKFTGQRLQAELGIYWFQSRWMDPSLGRFTQPDTIVPTSTQGTQAWDRYAFVNNNPVRYNDPTGHDADCGIGETCPEDEEETTPPPSDDPCIKYGQSSPQCQTTKAPSTPSPATTSSTGTPPAPSSATTPSPTPPACLPSIPGTSNCPEIQDPGPGLTLKDVGEFAGDAGVAAVQYCVGPPDLSGAASCGQMYDQVASAFPGVLPPIGIAWDAIIGTIHAIAPYLNSPLYPVSPWSTWNQSSYPTLIWNPYIK